MAGFQDRDNADDLRRQFADARDDLAQDLSSTVTRLRRLTDWRQVVRLHPWWALAGAMAVGYLAVPRSRACSVTLQRDDSQPPSANEHAGVASSHTSVLQVLAQSAVRMLLTVAAERTAEALRSRFSTSELAAEDPTTSPSDKTRG